MVWSGSGSGSGVLPAALEPVKASRKALNLGGRAIVSDVYLWKCTVAIDGLF
jgi:hypothetical protein